MKITMLLSNGFAPDPRVAAEASALREAGHQVTILAWDRTGKLPAVEEYRGIKVIRSQIITTYSKGPLQIFRFQEFWKECRQFLKQNPAEVIHCHDLDTLWPGIASGRKSGIPVIFDAHESYPDMVAHLFPKPVVALIRGMERSLVPKATAVITVGRLLAGHFADLHANKVIIVGNYKKQLAAEPVFVAPPPPLQIVYVGGLNRDRLLGPMIEAVAGDTRFLFRIIGDGPERARLENLAQGAANVIFTGFLPQEQARQLIDNSHLVYYGVDGRFPNNQYSAPNSLFLALAAGRPVITTDIGEIACIVKDETCGTVLDDLQQEQIIKVLESYFNLQLWRNQSDNSFQASRNTYNWTRAEQNLLALYSELESQPQ